jgi:aspartyl-tRNA(Asn)/glutamyl-tRNA(Gln) amidotransferase subunit A
MTRSVQDAALLLDIMSRPEPRDPFAWPIPFLAPDLSGATNLHGLRIAVSPRMGCHAPLVDAQVDELVAQAAPLLADAGASVSAASIVWPCDPLEPFEVFWEIACLTTVDGFSPEQQLLLDPLLRGVAQAGRSKGLGDYLRAQQQRLMMSVAAKVFFQRFDLFVGPVMPVPAFSVERDVPPGYSDFDWQWCPYTYPWNMTGYPAASVPIGFTKQGLPVGVQIVGPMGAEHDVLRAAAAIEARRPLYRQHPQVEDNKSTPSVQGATDHGQNIRY